MGEWRPISTAPKDGTDVITYTADTGSMRIDFYDDNSSDAGKAWMGKPTHWMPLPEPPAEVEEGE